MTVQEKKDLVAESLGYEQAFNELAKAMGDWELEPNLDYIIRMHDLDTDIELNF